MHSLENIDARLDTSMQEVKEAKVCINAILKVGERLYESIGVNEFIMNVQESRNLHQ